MSVFLIITYGDRYLHQCISSITKYHNDIPIYIVDNKLDSNNDIKGDNIHYSKNCNNNYELGAIWFATKKWPLIDKFIILQNSMVLLQKLPEFVFTDEIVPFWQANVIDYSPVVPIVEKMLAEQQIILKKNKPWKSICGCCCSINTNILKTLIESNYDKLFATNKNEAVACEILLGYIIENIMHISYKNVLYEFPIYIYYNKKRESIFIKKIGGGQGTMNMNIRNYKLPDKFNIIYEIHKNNISLTDNYINLLKCADNNDDFGNYLISNYPNTLYNENKSICRIINSITHRMFTKKYFKDAYAIEYNEIINKTKIIM